MSGWTDHLLLAAALAALWLTGAALAPRSRTFDAFTALAAGALAVSFFMAAWLTCGVLPPRPVLPLLPAAAWLIRLFLRRRCTGADGTVSATTRASGPRRPRIVLCGLIALWAVFTAWLAWATLATSLFSLAGQGIWGYKAKLFFLEGGWPAGFWTDSAFAHAQPTYPPAFPLVALWGYVWLGGVNDHVIQLLPVIFLAAAILLLLCDAARRGPRGWMAGALALALYLSPTFWMPAKLFYAEPMLLFLALVGLRDVVRHPRGRSGWLFLSSAAWVKNEGGLVVLAAAVSHVVAEQLHRRRPRRAAFTAPAAALVLAAIWPLWARAQGATLPDFGWSGIAHAWCGLAAAAGGFWNMAFRHGADYAGLWLLAPAVVLGQWRRWRRRETFLALFAGALTAACVGLYAFSRSPAPDWHIASSLNRLLLVPAAALWMLVARLLTAPRTAAGPARRRLRGPAWLALVLAVATPWLHGRERCDATARAAQAWTRWRPSAAPFNYADPRMQAHRAFLEAEVRPGERVFFLPDPRPCTPAYAAHIEAAYFLCPRRLLRPGGDVAPTDADALYVQVAHEDVIADALKRHHLPRPPVRVESARGHTLLRWK